MSGETGGSRVLRRAVRVVIGLALIGLIASRIDLGELSLRPSPGLFAGAGGALVLLVLAQLLSAVRWRAVLRDPAIGVVYLFRLFLAGQFFGLFVPTVAGGDAVRALALSRATGRPAAAVSSVVADRLLGVAALLLYLLGAAVVFRGVLPGLLARAGWAGPGGGVLVIGGVGLIVVLALAAFSWRRFKPRLEPRLAAARELLVVPPRVWLGWLGLSMLVQATYILIWLSLARGLGLPVPPAFFFLAVPLVSLAAMLPITISGLGVREGVWIVLLRPFGVAAADAVGYSLLYFFCFAAVAALGGVWFSLAGLSRADEAQPPHAGNTTRVPDDLAQQL